MPVAYNGFSSVAQLIAEVTQNPAQVSGASVGAESFTVPGARPGMHFVVSAPSLEANLGIAGAECTADDTVVVRIINPTANPINPAEQTFYFIGL